jgi:tetratricopeptide (TPR) repeat protein
MSSRRLAGLALAACCSAACAARTPVAQGVEAGIRSKRTGVTVESRDAGLKAALARLARVESAEHHRQLASEYRRLGVVDEAHDHLMASTRLEPKNPAGYDELARLWRDSGFPQFGLPYAHKAVRLAPRSPIPQNTLGTVLEALGQRREARRAYWKALELDSNATYALSNLSRLLKAEFELVRAAQSGGEARP